MKKLPLSLRALRIFLALVWLVMGLGCKVLGWEPRHEEIVARILGEDFAPTLIILIGLLLQGLRCKNDGRRERFDFVTKDRRRNLAVGKGPLLSGGSAVNAGNDPRRFRGLLKWSSRRRDATTSEENENNQRPQHQQRYIVLYERCGFEESILT